MKLKKLQEILLLLNFVLIQILVKPVASNLSYENKIFVKIKQDPTRFQQASAYRNKKHIFATRYLNVTTLKENNMVNAYTTSRLNPLGTDRNYSQDKINIDHINDKAVTQENQYKKWQVGRVSRKQYEIINMLWRKTKIFDDLEPTTPNYNFRRSNETERIIDSHSAFRQPFSRFPSRPNLPSTTPSYIEFYYLDETDERLKEFTTKKHIQVPKQIRENHLSNLGKFKFVLADSPMFSFRIDDPIYKPSPIPARYMHPTSRLKRRKSITHDSSLTAFDSLNSLAPSYKFPRKRTLQNKMIMTTTIKTTSKANITLNLMKKFYTSENTIENETCADTPTEISTTLNDTSEGENTRTTSINVMLVKDPTTAYDKIKFFETYDKHTPVSYYDEKGKLMDMDNIGIYVRGNELNNERKTLLEHVDESIGNEHSNLYKVKLAKKHIIGTNYKGDFKDLGNDNSVGVTQITKNPVMSNVSKIANVTKTSMIQLLLPESKLTDPLEYKKSKQAEWSHYSFAAVYVYEPSQVYCDAAGISPHWLITSGSCLSRHHENPGGEGRSAFVTYCGESWWNPERVAYVKYSLVHPRFHPRDKSRRHLYNIGLIQVVTSMASACNGWAPISLMSHQFVTVMEGSIANAIGWGLDRFDARYSSSDLPKIPLMTFESQVFSDSCPGNVGYSKAKRLDEKGGTKNVYCLALPPYSGEETDPIHGSLLLVGGKLVALYLQEERRPWGDQCAQYTGTWRLVPWVLDVARENDENDAFTLEI